MGLGEIKRRGGWEERTRIVDEESRHDDLQSQKFQVSR